MHAWQSWLPVDEIPDVRGERQNGSVWLVVGQGPYGVMQGERGGITVTTSDLVWPELLAVMVTLGREWGLEVN